ncbi:hypothetical protein D3C73_1474210 [compost metagenome]|uniref:Uncharacterized protein n=1 Tax=Paenibacillus jilunlii TaxID=682956 RepID=A0A1G9RCV0_9BACL|nr:hypothetical protein [Paenibacillus jilunlii]KWX76719.1 hypothetical protein AML91_09460 [Paenibacillus jilunlii]SDM20880.1 hypothetical protein SAMN05216191_11049 [Paenibacillus jilunlii]
MKILLIYAVLALLGLSMVISIDWLTGTPFSRSFNFLTKIFITTTFQELVVIIVFLFLPVIQVALAAGKKQKQRQ